MRLPIKALTTLAALTLASVAYSEVFIEKTVLHGAPGGPSQADLVTTRQIIVNGIASVGRSWIAHEEFSRYAARVSSTVPKSQPLAPLVQVSSSALSVVQFLPSGAVRVLQARPATAPGTTSVWEADLKLADFFRQLDETGRGIAPGRDHPIIGAPASARRANVVEAMSNGYTYCAVYVSSNSPRALVTERIARLKALGATLDAEQHSPSYSQAALRLSGRRIDFSAIHEPGHAATELVVQTDLPPVLPRERSP